MSIHVGASRLRSMLFVPADSERKPAKPLGSAADVLILDLEDAVVETRKVGARGSAAEFIGAQAAQLEARLFVRINPLDTALAMGDLAAVVMPGLAGIMLPKTQSAMHCGAFGGAASRGTAARADGPYLGSIPRAYTSGTTGAPKGVIRP